MTEPLRLLYWAAGVSLAAGLMHGLLTDAHFAEWWAYGVFFVIASVAQAMYGFVILASHVMNGAPITQLWTRRARRAWYATGIAGNALLVALYVASRTVGVLGEREPWDGPGLFTKGLEVALVALLALLLWKTRPAPTPRT